MAGTHISIQVDDAEVRAALQRLTDRVGNLSRPLRDLGELLLKSTDDRFRAQRAPDGSAWAQNSDVTLLRYLTKKKGLSKRRTATGGRTLTQRGARALGAKRILRDGGDLQDLLRYQVTGNQLALGSNRQYAAMMQFGGRKAQWPHLWGDIPARPFLGLSAADRQAVLSLLARHLLAGR